MNDVGLIAAPPRLELLNRERSILEFNRRVLAQARRDDVPLLERLRYICIVSSNLDEFFEVRFADFLEAAKAPGTGVSRLDLHAVAQAAHALIDDQYAAFNDEVMPALMRHGIVILNHSDRDESQRRWVAQFFQRLATSLLPQCRAREADNFIIGCRSCHQPSPGRARAVRHGAFYQARAL